MRDRLGATAVQITCDLVKPESAVVTSLDLQVQVQTRFGLSRTATAAFAQCGQECQNGGTCWWSKDIANVECVCAQLYYGAWCQNGSCARPLASTYWLLTNSPLGVRVRVGGCVCRVFEGRADSAVHGAPGRRPHE